MKHFTTFLLTLVLVLSPLGVLFTPQIAAAAPEGYSGHPTIYIRRVVRDNSVTFRAYNLPADDEFRVRMGRMGTRGVGGVIVGSFDTDDGGTMTLTFDIPSKFHGDARIAIRIESKTGSGYFAYNWFYNNTAGGGAGTGSDDGYSGHPTIHILSVVRNKTVTVRIRNLPADDEFRVLMGRYGTRGVNGVRVASIDTEDGGNRTLTFDIPARFKGQARIAIRIESKTGSGYFAYNWFFNRTAN